jgi:hypothetical protein
LYKMILNKVILIISSFFVATNAQCPTWWWPMSNVNSSINFFSEVMRGNNIIAMPGVSAATINTFSVPDRMAAGKNYKSITLTAIQYIVLPADSYFCNGAFTITFFYADIAVADATTFADFLDVTSTNSVTFAIGTAATETFTLKIGATTSTSGTLTAYAGSATAFAFVAVSYGGAGSTPIFFQSTVASNSAPPGVPGFTPIPIAPTCSIMTIAHIGASTANPPDSPLARSSLNDFKIYNFGLTTAQVQARYAAEVGKILKYIINSKILAI